MILMALAVLSGALVGFSLGLVGGGGSILATPLLLYVVGVNEPHIAIGTSALAVSINAYLNFLSYIRTGAVRWRSGIIFALIGSIGALAGSTLGKALDANRLLFLFGILMLIVGLLMLRPRRPKAMQPDSTKPRSCCRSQLPSVSASPRGSSVLAVASLSCPAWCFRRACQYSMLLRPQLCGVRSGGLAGCGRIHCGGTGWRTWRNQSRREIGRPQECT